MRINRLAIALCLFLAACKGDGPPRDWDRRAQAASNEEPSPPEEDDWGEDESGGTGTAMALEEGKMGKKDSDRAEGPRPCEPGLAVPQAWRRHSVLGAEQRAPRAVVERS